MNLPVSERLASPLSAGPDPVAVTALGVLRALLLILVVFAFVSQVMRLAGDPVNPASQNLQTLSGQLDIAIVGDSRAHTGLSPNQLAEAGNHLGRSPLRVYNFAVDGTDLLHHASFVLHGLLQQSIPPPMILWAANPLGFNALRLNNRLEQLVAADLPVLWSSGAPVELLLDVATAQVFRPYRQRPICRRLVEHYAGRAVLRANWFQHKVLGLKSKPVPESREYLPAHAGYGPFKIREWRDRFERGMDFYRHKYASTELGEWQFRVARHAMRCAREAGTHVVMVEMPVAPWYGEHLAAGSFHQAWRQKMRSLAAEEGATFMEDAGSVAEDEKFGDPAHLGHGAAEAYSGQLARKLGDMEKVRALFSQGRGGVSSGGGQ